MQDATRFEGGRTAAVGLIDGTTKTGTLKAFHPGCEVLELDCATRGARGKLDKVGVQIPVESTSFVAIYRTADDPPNDLTGREETKVYTPHGGKYAVAVRPADLEDPLGFVGVPISKASLYREIFFYRERISAVEDPTPLGELLVREGFIAATDVEEGAKQQEAERSVPIGRILVEEGVVGENAVEAAVEVQPTKIGFGGKRLRLGEILVDTGLATKEQIEHALSEQRKRRGMRLGEVLVEAGIVSEETIARALAMKFRIPYVDLDAEGIDSHAVEEIPLGIIKRFRVFPFRSDDRVLRIAMADPTAVEALDMLRFSLGKRLQECAVRPSQLEAYLRPFFPEENPEIIELEAAVDHLIRSGGIVATSDDDEAEDEDPALREEGSVIRLAYQVILNAEKRGASDIHIEPNGKEKPTRIRQRVDGQCEIQRTVPPRFAGPLVSRMKILAGLDITERRLPQDGKIKLDLPDRKLELRVATLPTAEGNEDVVLRLLAQGGAIPMKKLGMSERNFAEASRCVHQPYGLFLVVGPTGSGKTTTLHSCLSAINTDARKIWTAEDPVEITQSGLRQVQMKPKIGLTFANAMRSFLRADPDVIMVGEMRDYETAHIGIEASLTGHLVMSTLHTNSAPETITRLIDMELDPFTFADALLGVLAQRLARRICADCKTPYEASAEEVATVLRLYGEQAEADGIGGDGPMTLFQGAGCEACGGTGYRGRVGVHELLINDDEVRRRIQKSGTVTEIRAAAVAAGMRTLIQDGLWKALQGLTDLRQVQAVCGS